MKIFFLGPGSSIHLKRPLIQILEQNIEVVFAGQVNPIPEGNPNYKFVFYPFFGKCIYRKVGHWLGDNLALLTYVPLLQRIKRIYHPDITHVHWIDCHAYYCVQANLRPLVLSVWGSDINNCFKPDADLKENQMIGTALSQANKIIVDSADMFEKCSTLANRSLENIERLSLGINTRIFNARSSESISSLRDKYNLPSDACVLLSIRAFAPLYQHEKILLAFAQAIPSLRKKTVLVLRRFNESNEKYYKQIIALVKQLGITDYIYWIDQVPTTRISDLYHISDVLINFPAQDTFPISFLEAAACEKPVITNYLPAYKNTFVENGFRIVYDGSVPGLSKAIIDELENSPTSREILQSTHHQIIENYSDDIYKKRLMKIYNDLFFENKTQVGRT